MTGLGSVDEPLNLTGERLSLTTRTDDPVDPVEGQAWIRDDKNSGDWIAIFRYYDGDSTQNIPIFDINEGNEKKALRALEINGEDGYIPIESRDNADHPKFSVQTDSGWLGFTGTAIPDEDVYLHDEWGDNKYEDRDGTGTFDYNNVQGVYHPEWTVETGSASVSDEKISLDDDPTILSASINLDLDETVKWFWRVQDSDGRHTLGLFAETNAVNTDAFPYLEDGYHIQNSPPGDDDRTMIIKKAANGNDSAVTDEGPYIDDGYVGAERQSDGSWTLYATTDSLSDPKTDLFQSEFEQGTGTDTTHENPSYIGLGQSGATGSKSLEVKSF